MKVAMSTGWVDSTVQSVTEQGLLEANQVASAIKERWREGEPANVAAVLDHHPQLRHYRSVVLDLAYQEFKCRSQAGEDLDVEAFAQRFPSLRRSLCLLIGVQDLVSHDPDLRALQGLLPWPEPGDQFLQFKLIGEIGRGTFGRVFLAIEPSLGNRPIVVKVAPHGGQEAEILGKLRHPNVVPVYSLQEDDETGLAAFCMPYLGRATLCDVLDHAFVDKRPPMRAHTILEAVRAADDDVDMAEPARPDALLRKGSYVDGIVHLGVQLADALAYSHGRGIYHRDIKPSNVLMTAEGRPLLLDFNLSLDGRLLTGRIGGTVPYMAPEELRPLFEKRKDIRQRHYDPRSDVYSLGAILYELLTGVLPFGAIPWNRSAEELAAELYRRQQKGPIPIRQHNSQVDSRLARVIESCLAFEPESRPETAQKLADVLRTELAAVRRAARWMGNHRKFVAGTTAIVLALALATTLFFALRPPFSVRQYQLALAYGERGQYNEAVDCLTGAIRAHPNYGEALFARGCAYQHLGQFPTAIPDYTAAHRLTRSPLSSACEAYCLSRMNSHRAAIALYGSALDAGYDQLALVYNNIAHSYLMLRELDNAEAYLRRAIRLDDRLQAVHFNFVVLALRRNKQPDEPLPQDALVHAAKAIAIGPATGELYHTVAALYATAAKHDTHYLQPAIECVGKAVELGYRRDAFTADGVFSALQREPAFRDATQKPVLKADSPRPISLMDPLDKS
jgi:eukaryotic-like serine/threonine-protein kinase